MSESVSGTVLEFRDVSFSYAEGRADSGFRHVSFSLAAGEVALLCGPSGCGKSSVLRAANGLIPHYHEGVLDSEVKLAGRSVRSLELYEGARFVGSVFQNPRTQFYNVDVRGEVAFTCENLGFAREEVVRRTDEALREFSLEDLREASLFDLSGGQKQRVACASVSAAAPKLFVLDEPSSNLDAASTRQLRECIARWKRAGAAILVAEHRLHYLNGLVDKVLLMEGGCVSRVWEGDDFFSLSPNEAASLGLRTTSLEALAGDWDHLSSGRGEPGGLSDGSVSCASALADGRAAADTAAPTLELKGFRYEHRRAKRRLGGISIAHSEFRAGEVVAIVGRNGAGKTTFANSLCGIVRAQGEVLEGGVPLAAKARRKLAYLVMQDVNHQLFCESVMDEVLLGSDAQGEGGAPSEQVARAALRALGLEEFADAHPRSLSGGQKQRVCIAGALMSARPMVILDEPTSGLDYLCMMQVSGVLRELAKRGKTVMVVTHDPELIAASCDRVCLIDEGDVSQSYTLDAAGMSRMVEYFGGA